MDLTITIDDVQAEDGTAINAGNLRELCERTISEKATQWAVIRQTETDRVLLIKVKAAPAELLAQVEAVAVPVPVEEPVAEPELIAFC